MSRGNYCSIIHGGLHLIIGEKNTVAKHCCLRQDNFLVDTTKNFWNDKVFHQLRNINIDAQWSPGCDNCRLLEAAGYESFRTGMNAGLGIDGQYDLSGPARIDLTFDISCNLACRTCGPNSSSFWQKHLKDHNHWSAPIHAAKNKHKVIDTLAQLDLSNLRMLVFCGGETLLGQEYWDVANWLAHAVPNAKQQLTLCFQTNGTQTVHPRNYEIIEKFKLVKLQVSLDGIEQQFEYLRWPASWNQVTDNLLLLRQQLPSNVMFLIEETLSIFNLATSQRLTDWASSNFAHNREGDVVVHTKHQAHGIFGLHALSNSYVSSLQGSSQYQLVPKNFKENINNIITALREIYLIDSLRNQSFATVFPEAYQHYQSFNVLATSGI